METYCYMSLTLSTLWHCSQCNHCGLRGFSSEAQNVGCMHYSKCNILSTTASRTLRFGTLMATWMFYNLSESDVKFDCFYHSHHCPSRQKSHPKLLSLYDCVAPSLRHNVKENVHKYLKSFTFCLILLQKVMDRMLALVTSLYKNQVHMYCCKSFFVSQIDICHCVTWDCLFLFSLYFIGPVGKIFSLK